MTTFAKRTTYIKPSATLMISARAQALQAQGKPIINFSVGEPDFDTPDFIKESAIKAIYEGFTKYTPVSGTASLKQAIINKFKRDNELEYKSSQILVSCGAKQCIYNAVQAIIDEHDEVIIPAPFWVSYPEIVLLAGGKPVIIDGSFEHHFKITPEALRKAITTKTKLVILNSPSNPTGVAYSLSELRALGEVLREYSHVYILSDDIYEHTLWSSEPFANILNACPDLYDRVLIVNGVSKTYAMTGWRIGYVAANERLIAVMSMIQSQCTSNPSSISQVAAETALKGDQTCVTEMCAVFKTRHDLAVKALNEIPGVECLAADGTFYLFPRIQKLLEQSSLTNDLELAEYLLEKAFCAVVPGSAFGAPGFLRLSIALSTNALEQGLKQIAKAINELTRA